MLLKQLNSKLAQIRRSKKVIKKFDNLIYKNTEIILLFLRFKENSVMYTLENYTLVSPLFHTRGHVQCVSDSN